MFFQALSAKTALDSIGEKIPQWNYSIHKEKFLKKIICNITWYFLFGYTHRKYVHKQGLQKACKTEHLRIHFPRTFWRPCIQHFWGTCSNFTKHEICGIVKYVSLSYESLHDREYKCAAHLFCNCVNITEYTHRPKWLQNPISYSTTGVVCW